ncbi:hypothetical protein LTR22_027161 [Elasticomyces elasticus]|nr:hypothetical protein LTR22_027161 [Elasticomyces elasticus]
MLPRLRVLKTLSERLQGNAGTKTESAAVKSSWQVGFNNLALSGAFSVPKVNALCGMWLRNLKGGIKYWMVIPEASMVSEQGAFKNKGDEWLPGGRERLIVLQKDDVLLIPPDLRVVHAVHSPVSCLTEGGMLWDEMNTLETLRSTAWTRESRVMTNEEMAYQLPGMISNLKRLVRARADKFRGTQGSTQFLEAIENFGALAVHMRATILRSRVQLSGKRTALRCVSSYFAAARHDRLWENCRNQSSHTLIERKASAGSHNSVYTKLAMRMQVYTAYYGDGEETLRHESDIVLVLQPHFSSRSLCVIRLTASRRTASLDS